jgi:hypothetical protein
MKPYIPFIIAVAGATMLSYSYVSKAECYGYNCVNYGGQSMTYNEMSAEQHQDYQIHEQQRELDNMRRDLEQERFNDSLDSWNEKTRSAW